MWYETVGYETFGYETLGYETWGYETLRYETWGYETFVKHPWSSRTRLGYETTYETPYVSAPKICASIAWFHHRLRFGYETFGV